MQLGQIILGLAFPANEERAETIVPAAGPLDDPASGFALVHWPEHQGWLAPFPFPSNVGHDPPCTHRYVAVREVVTLIEAEVLGPARSTRRSEHHGIERGREHPLVVHIRSAHEGGERHPSRIGQEVTLRPALRPVGRVRARVIPPFGALTMNPSSAVHCHRMPRWRS